MLRNRNGVGKGRALAILTAASLSAPACAPGSPVDKGRDEPAASERTLKMAIGDPVSLDPARASNRWQALVAKQICDTLVSFDPRTASLKPAIAQSWMISEDAKAVTFKLRKVKFHDGTQLSADDYVASLSRFVHPESGSAEHFLLRRVEGYTQVRSGQSGVLSGVRAVDPATLEVRLSEPFAEFPAVLANPSAGSATPRAAVEQPLSDSDPASNPVCTGPYRLERPWKKGRDISLIRFRDYYGLNAAFAQGAQAVPRKILLKPVADDPAAFALFEQGQVDLAPVPVNRLAAARSVTNRVSSAPSGYMSYVGLPVRRPPYDNLELRRALALSVEREPLLERLALGLRASPTGFLPAAAGPASRQDNCPRTFGVRANVGAAKRALAASGLEPGKQSFTVYLNSGGGHERWLEPLVEQWKNTLGIDVRLDSSAWPQYLDRLVSAGPDGPFRLAWVVKFPSSEAVLQPLLESGSPDNLTGFSSPAFDDLLKRARATTEDQARRDLYADAARLLCREVPIIPIWHGENHYAFGKNWRSVAGRPLDRVDVFGDPVLRELSAD